MLLPARWHNLRDKSSNCFGKVDFREKANGRRLSRSSLFMQMGVRFCLLHQDVNASRCNGAFLLKQPTVEDKRTAKTLEHLMAGGVPSSEELAQRVEDIYCEQLIAAHKGMTPYARNKIIASHGHGGTYAKNVLAKLRVRRSFYVHQVG